MNKAKQQDRRKSSQAHAAPLLPHHARRPLRLALVLLGIGALPAFAAIEPPVQPAAASQAAAGQVALIDGLVQQQGARGGILIQARQRPDYDVNVLDDGRLVQIDFLNTRFGPTVQPVRGSGNVRLIKPSNLAASHTARLELLLNQPMPVMVEPAAGGYRIAFASAIATAPAAPVPAAQAASVPPAGAVSPATPAIADMTFHRGANNAGRMEIQVAQGTPSPDVQRQGDRLLVDLPNTRLPAHLERRLDVTEFGTPVRTVDSYQRGRDTRLVFTVPAAFDYTAYQVGSKLVVEVKPRALSRADDPSKAEPGKPYTGARFSMDFQAIDIRNALQVIADFTGLNIVMADNVTGTLTMRLKNVPWDQALDVILESKGLGMRRDGNVIWVAPQKDLDAAEEARLKAEQSKIKLEPLVTELIQVNYAKAEELAELLKASSGTSTTTSRTNTSLDGTRQETEIYRTGLLTSLGLSGQLGNNLLSERGAVTVDNRTNSLLVKETPSNLANIKRLIAKLDRPVRQIMIESRIVVATTNASRSLGVQWGGSYNDTTGYDFPYSIDLSGAYAGGQVGGARGVVTPSPVVNFPATPTSGFTPASLGFRVGSFLGNKILDFQLSAIEAEGQGKVVSSPRVITADQQKAIIEQGKEIPYQQATSSGATAVSFKKAVLSLEVTPRITPDGKVNLDVLATRDSKGEIVPGGVAIDTRKVKTKVLVDNGETVVIGGIYEEEENQQETGVPGLRKLPLLGQLFKNRTKFKNQTELLIFLTPKILDGPVK
ncbi:MAG: type IV pilus secretin PilQ [Pseudomonadota bacterium]